MTPRSALVPHAILPATTPLAPVADERSLVEGVRQGNEGAFDAIFRTYYLPIRVFIQTYVHAPEVAEECAQDVFFRIGNGAERGGST